jgi:hypothetical protein
MVLIVAQHFPALTLLSASTALAQPDAAMPRE